MGKASEVTTIVGWTAFIPEHVTVVAIAILLEEVITILIIMSINQ